MNKDIQILNDEKKKNLKLFLLLPIFFWSSQGIHQLQKPITALITGLLLALDTIQHSRTKWFAVPFRTCWRSTQICDTKLFSHFLLLLFGPLYSIPCFFRAVFYKFVQVELRGKNQIVIREEIRLRFHHCFFAKIFISPLIILPNQIKFIIARAVGTTITRR